MSQHIDPEVKQSFIINDLTTNDAGKALSAAQGKVLKDAADVLNSKTTTPTVLQVSSYSDFQTQIASTINNMANNEIRSIIIQKTGASDAVFKGATWFGQIGKLTNSYVTIMVTAYNGDVLRLWLANGTWYYNNVIDTLNSNISILTTEKLDAWSETTSLSTPLSGESYGNGSYYYKFGRFVFIAISIKFASPPTNVKVFTLPSSINPSLESRSLPLSGGNSYLSQARAVITPQGNVFVTSEDNYVMGSGIYML